LYFAIFHLLSFLTGGAFHKIRNPLNSSFIVIEARLPDGRQVTRLDFLMLDARPVFAQLQASSFEFRYLPTVRQASFTTVNPVSNSLVL